MQPPVYIPVTDGESEMAHVDIETLAVNQSQGESHTVRRLKEQQKVALSLNLCGQVQLIDRQIILSRYEEIVKSPPLSSKKLMVWKAYLPQPYKGREFYGYVFDVIPELVLRKWQEWDDLNVFQTFEIWTNKTNAMLVGITDDNHHVLARWGREEEQMLTFEEVMQKVKEATLKRCGDYDPFFPTFLGALFGFVAPTMIIILLLEMGVISDGPFLVMMYIICVVLSSLFLGFGTYFTAKRVGRKRAFLRDTQNNPLLKAIADLSK